MSDDEILAAVRGDGLVVRVEGIFTSLSRTPVKGLIVRLSIQAPPCMAVLREELMGTPESR
ncbi:hypothetical protein [Pseudomonas nitroreducens]|uniref:hypothetical protein n=1 Tax=Pseudomonas nitroreducens TaxID=46680 RepID=UPI00209FD102|nr:hypothetical protein [Pseudomonas nitroreducens]MCP1625490.1 hypothetical protein [Pseudomonas nitroreducens]